MTAYMLRWPCSFRSAAGWRTGSERVPCFGGAIGVFTASSSPVRREQRADGIYCCARSPGIRRGHDGAGRAARRAAHHCETGSDALDRRILPGPGLMAPVLGPPARWIHHDLFVLAMDFLS